MARYVVEAYRKIRGSRDARRDILYIQLKLEKCPGDTGAATLTAPIKICICCSKKTHGECVVETPYVLVFVTCVIAMQLRDVVVSETGKDRPTTIMSYPQPGP